MKRRKLSVPSGFRKKIYAEWRPSVKDEFLTAIGTKPKIPYRLSGNWKAIVFSACKLFRRRLFEFHHPDRSTRLVK
jgi:hypothetical protein